MTDLEQRVARAICLGKGVDPDMCVAGSGALPGDPGFVCQQYAWELELPTAKAALKAHGEWLAEQGLVVVPREPTARMVGLGHLVASEPGDEWAIQRQRNDDIATYKAMISAAQQPEKVE